MTIREIALACGVSRGTVDRVINGRGKVHPETEKMIIDALNKAGYQKNIVGRALTVRKTNPVIAVILASEGNPFFNEVIDGIKKAESELTDYGVKVHIEAMRGYKKLRQLELIDAIAHEAQVLVLQPIDDALIVQKVNELYDSGLRTVTINSDIEGSKRLCYVGSDYVKGGRTAAGVLRLMTGGQGRLGILTGVASVLGHRQRLEGFLNRLKKTCPDMTIADMRSAEDDEEQAYSATHAMLSSDPAIDTLMVIAAGLKGVCDAVRALERQHKIRIFAFDNTPATKQGMKEGIVKAVVCQQPFEQGYRAVKAAFDIILSGNVPLDRVIMENQIKILENLDEVGGI